MKPPPPEAATHLLYLHGFRSSPQSFKALMVQRWLAAHRPEVVWFCPANPPSPKESLLSILEQTAAWPRQTMAVVGSSLGGFYARHLARHWGCRGVALNPAVHPARDLAGHVGLHPVWQQPGQTVAFERQHLAEFADWHALPSAPWQQPMLAVVAQGDELLDWREMTLAHARDEVLLLAGSDHGLSDFEVHLPAVVRYLGWD